MHLDFHLGTNSALVGQIATIRPLDRPVHYRLENVDAKYGDFKEGENCYAVSNAEELKEC